MQPVDTGDALRATSKVHSVKARSPAGVTNCLTNFPLSLKLVYLQSKLSNC